jgi:hypothetical protein
VASKLFQKRKAEAARRALREQSRRKEQVRILLVCEGSKTEPNYLIEFFKLDGGGRVEPYATRDHGTAPTTLLNQAKEILSRDPDFDLAFVVGDRDEFPDFLQARNAAGQIKSSPKIKYVFSDPCFELWFLLHFELHDAPVARNDVCKKLGEHVRGYDKGCLTMARDLYPLTDVAIGNSKALRERLGTVDATCPSTLVDMLIEEVREARANFDLAKASP